MDSSVTVTDRSVPRVPKPRSRQPAQTESQERGHKTTWQVPPPTRQIYSKYSGIKHPSDTPPLTGQSWFKLPRESLAAVTRDPGKLSAWSWLPNSR